MGVKVAIGEMLPCTAIEACTIFFTIMASTAMSKLGMSSYVFVVYTNALSFILLIPFSFLFHRRDKTEEPLFTFPLMLRASFLGLVGVKIAQTLAFAGLSYSSPVVAIGAANMIPAFSFIIAIILRKKRIEWKRQGSIVRVIGTLISMVGILGMTFYKGPVVKQYSSSFLHLATSPHLFIFTSTHENWVLGCFLFASASFALSIWNIIQVGTHPHVMKITCVYTLFGTIQSALLALIVEKDVSVWRLKLDMELLVIVLTCSNMVLTFERALLYPIFKPVGVVVASTCGCVLFAATFHYGSMLSAFIYGLGYYTTLWGQLKEDETIKRNMSAVPLLQQDSQV